MSEPEHNKFNINGYDVYHTNRKNKRGGGVALYVKQELACKFLAILNAMRLILSVNKALLTDSIISL